MAAKKKRKTHSPEFVDKALTTWDKLRSEGQSAATVAKQLGVSDSRLYYWQAQRNKAAASVKKTTRAKSWGSNGHVERATATPASHEGKRSRARSSEVLALKQEIEALKEENKILRAAAMVFARHN